MVQLKLSPIRNEKLFSRYYLEKKVPESDAWKEDEEKVKKAFEEIKKLYEKEKGKLEKYKESQLEKNFIWKILDIINPHYEIREPTKKGDLEPDYGFFKNKKDLDNAHELKKEKDFYKNVIAVGDAKRWGTKLDKQNKKAEERWDKTNPSFQIFVYLKETPANWGILTDGRSWRLYTAEEAKSLEIYYEVDLETILQNENLEAFKYFYYFFRRKAFIKDKSGKSFLDKVYTGSVIYSKSVGKELEDRLYRALELMAKGYFAVSTNRIDGEPLDKEKHLERVHKNSLIFLYRLIFVLYAEANGLLKSEKIPSEYDVNKIIENALGDSALDVEHPDEVEETSALYDWRLNRIFRLIDKGSEEYAVPAYDGGLFDNNKYPFFKIREDDKEHNKIRNNYLAHVIKLLTKAEGGEGESERRIDYADLSIKHIGGIYEGLLEHDLKISKDSRMVCVKNKWIRDSETDKDFEDFDKQDKAEKGEIYLATDEGKRKATGSYYTPEYIVNYIVENALVRPLVDERFEEIDEKHPPGKEPDKNKEAKRKCILSLNILDPAMGSGHFLVEVTDCLAQKLSPYLREEELDDINEGEHSDKTIAKRLVLKNCIYGVDINPLATELAKVSLWLTTIMSDKPLQFLSHHLKTGNSLVGADINELATHPKKSGEGKRKGLEAFVEGTNNKDGIHEKMKKLVEVFKDLEEQREEERTDINKEKKIYDKFLNSDFRVKFDILADVYTSYYFGKNFSEKKYQRLLDAFKEGGEAWEEIIQKEWVRRATDSVENPKKNNLSDEKSFFHWQLEFPDIFFDLETGAKKDDPGFDAVIGNPPYVRSDNIDNLYLSYLKEKFPAVVKSGYKTDLFAFFVNIAIKLSKYKISYILPNRIIANSAMENLRHFVLETGLKKLIDVSNFRDKKGKSVFPDAEVFPCVIVVDKQKRDYYQQKRVCSEEKLNNKNFQKISSWDSKELGVLINPRNPQEKELIREFISEEFKNLGDIAHVSEGLRGKTIQKSEYEKLEREMKERFQKEYRGKHIDKFFIKGFNGYYKLKKSKQEIEKEIENKNICDMTNEEEQFLPKISISELGSELNAALDENGWITYGGTYYIVDSKYNLLDLLSVLNSKLPMIYFHLLYEASMWGEGFKFRSSYLHKLPLPDLSEKNLTNYAKKLQKNKLKVYEEIQSFLEWIKAEWGSDINGLSLKTHLKKYWNFNFEEFMEVAKKNKSKIKYNVNSRDFRELMKKEWNKSVKTLKSMMEKIQDLKNKIDAIVFDLYNLTEEEVETVLDSLDTPEDEKKDILEKFREVKKD